MSLLLVENIGYPYADSFLKSRVLWKATMRDFASLMLSSREMGGLRKRMSAIECHQRMAECRFQGGRAVVWWNHFSHQPFVARAAFRLYTDEKISSN